MRSHLPALLELPLVILAVARVTVLLRADTITAWLRRWIWSKTKPESMIRELSVCPWCISVWVGAAAALAWGFGHGTYWLDVPALALAASWVAGALAATDLEPHSDVPHEHTHTE